MSPPTYFWAYVFTSNAPAMNNKVIMRFIIVWYYFVIKNVKSFRRIVVLVAAWLLCLLLRFRGNAMTFTACPP